MASSIPASSPLSVCLQLTRAISGTAQVEQIFEAALEALESGLAVREERYSLDQWREDAASGKLLEAFACGTAAVVTAIGRVAGHDGEFTVGSGGPGQITTKLREQLMSIQRGTAEDRHGWVLRLD